MIVWEHLNSSAKRGLPLGVERAPALAAWKVGMDKNSCARSTSCDQPSSFSSPLTLEQEALETQHQTVLPAFPDTVIPHAPHIAAQKRTLARPSSILFILCIFSALRGRVDVLTMAKAVDQPTSHRRSRPKAQLSCNLCHRSKYDR